MKSTYWNNKRYSKAHI